MSKRCQRIYEELKYVERDLHDHLIANEVPPELHLTRWLRCVMSREFDVHSTVIVWDYIFAGIMDANPNSSYDVLDLRAPQDDPFVNLEFLSVAMITLIRGDLLDAEDSMCLGLLMSYKVPEDPMVVINRAQTIRNAYMYAMPYSIPAKYTA